MADPTDEWSEFEAKLDAALDEMLATVTRRSRMPTAAEAATKAEQYREAVRQDPTDWNAFKMLARALKVCGKQSEARAAFLKAYQLRHPPD